MDSKVFLSTIKCNLESNGKSSYGKVWNALQKKYIYAGDIISQQIKAGFLILENSYEINMISINEAAFDCMGLHGFCYKLSNQMSCLSECFHICAEL